MSASLVGSEMCIRDSSLSSPCPPMAEEGGRGGKGELNSHGKHSGRKDICLLYTSDAADDM
eukprot:13190094-Alexandrium_andersonii.AAC.1